MEIATLIEASVTRRVKTGLKARVARVMTNYFGRRPVATSHAARQELARGYELMARRHAAAGDARGEAYYAAHARALAAVAG